MHARLPKGRRAFSCPSPAQGCRQFAAQFDIQVIFVWHEADLIDERADDLENLISGTMVIQGLVQTFDPLPVDFREIKIDNRK
jgi:hypothetical protein